MMGGPPDYDPRTVWQNQKEHAAPSLEEIMTRAEEFRRKSRRGAHVFWIALLLHLAVSVAEDFAGIKVWWVGVIRFALFITWVAYIPFRGLDDASPTILRIAGTTPVLDFYRRQLQRQRDYFTDNYRRIF